jgi:hypothetical protein
MAADAARPFQPLEGKSQGLRTIEHVEDTKILLYRPNRGVLFTKNQDLVSKKRRRDAVFYFRGEGH